MKRHATKPAEDLAAKRRAYLKTQGEAYIVVAVMAVLCLSALSDIVQRAPHLPIPILSVAVMLASVGGMIHIAMRQLKQAKEVPYVPPVREQAAALPAEEVLVRGSERPAPATDELVRAAAAADPVAAEELLRAGQDDRRGSS